MAQAVLHCYADYKWTGPSEPVALLCRELCRRGWRAELACGRLPEPGAGTFASRARGMGLTVHDGFYFGGRPNLGRKLWDMSRLSPLIQEGGYGIVHAHGSWDHAVAAAALDRSPCRAPLVRSDHRAHEYGGSILERVQFGPRWTKHLIVLSDRLRVRAVDRLGLDPDTVTTVRGAVDVNEHRPMDAPPGMRERFGLGAGDVVFGLVARVQRHRRFEVLLAAARLVKRRDPRVKIAVLGRGSQKKSVLDRPVARMGLQDTVRTLGYRTGDYREALATFDAGIMLVPGSDGSCRAALQMAAMGKPMVVAQRGVLPDIVRDGETGIVVDDTAENLAGAILEMADSADRRREWGRAARERMETLFSLERQAGSVIGVYERLLKK